MKKNLFKLFMNFTAIALCSCGMTNTNQHTIGLLLPKIFEKASISSSVRCDTFSIVGNGLYLQKSSIFDKGLYNTLKESEINEYKEDFNTRYGGTMSIYTFDDYSVRFWDNYLFVEGETSYKGDFYSLNKSLEVNDKTREFLSLHIDEGELKSSNYDTNSDELRDLLISLEFEAYHSNTSFNDIIDEISLNSLGSLKIYSETVFSIFQSPTLYKLNEGFSFSYIE